MIKKTALAALAALVVSTPAHAIDDGFYLGIGGGGSFLHDTGWSTSVPGVSATGDISVNPGFGVIAALGHQWKNGFGVEGEFGFRRNAVDKISASVAVPALGIAGSGTFTGGGNIDTLSLMANGRYGFDTGTAFTPFVLGGVGMARVGANNVSAAGVALVDDTDWVFAFQGGGGVNVALGNGFSAEVSYRFFGTTDPTFNSGGVDVEADGLKSHSIFLVLKYTLGGGN